MKTKEPRPLTYKDHKLEITVTEPIEPKDDGSPRHLFMPVFYEEMVTGTVGEGKDKEDFALSSAINGAALYFRRGKKWYVIKTQPLLEALMSLNG